jgi:hypothetical protein
VLKPEDVAIAGLLCALVIAVAVGTLIGAVFLRAAVALYNSMAGGASSPSSVPKPTFGKAMWITFATSLAQMGAGILIGGYGAAEPGSRGLFAQLISFPVSLLIMAGVLTAKLPTTFGRAILVTLCYMVVVLLVVGILVGIAVLVFGFTLGEFNTAKH